MRNKFTKLLALLLALPIMGHAQQLSEYTFSHDQVEFQTIVGTPGVRTPYLTNHDSGYDDITPSFSFPFGESTIGGNNSIRINANGYLQLKPTSNGGNNPFDNVWSNPYYDYKLIAPYVIADGNCNAPVGQGLYYADTTDSEGDSVLIFEFRQMTTWNARNSNTSINYQIRIKQDGTISVIYDTCVLHNATFTHTLLMTDGHADRLCLTGSWEEPSVGTPSTIPSLEGVPEAGTRYTFSRPANYCPRPSGLTLVEATAENVTLSWTGTASEYTVYQLSADGEWEEALTTAEAQTTIGDLESNTTYQFAVAALCEGELVSTLTSPIEVRTLCTALDEEELPFYDDFESYGSTWSPCWSRLFRNSDGTMSDDIARQSITYSSSESTSGEWSMHMRVSSNVNRIFAMAILPEINANLAGYQVSLNHKSSSATNNRLEVGIMENPTDTLTFVPLDTLDVTNEWGLSEVNLSSYQGEGHFIALRWSTTEVGSPYGGTTYYLYIDDITVMVPPTCARPDSITVAEIGETNATLTVHSTEDLDEAQFSITYFREGSDTITDYFDGPTYDFASLTPGKFYSVSVVRLCTDGSQTLPVATQFRTECGMLTANDLPYIEDFNSYEAYNGAPIDPCWTILDFNTGTTFRNPYPTAYSNHSGLNGKALYFNIASNGVGQFVSLPAFDDLSELALTFYSYASSTNPRIDVGVMEDPTDTLTFTPLYTVEPTYGEWQEHAVKLNTYEGEGHYITFRTYHHSFTSYSINIDDVVVDYAVTCPHPLSVSVTATTTSSLSLAITDTAATGRYQINYCADGSEDTLGLEVLTLTPTIEDLQPGTLYHISVQSICSDESITAAVECNGQTRCEALTEADLPLTEGFSNWPFGLGEPFGTCWNRFYTLDSTGMKTPNKIYVSNDAGSRALHLYSEASYSDGLQQSTVVLPSIEVGIRMLQFDMRMRFWAIYADSADYFEVGVMTDADDPTTFVPVHTIYNPGSQNYADYSLRFGRYDGTTGTLAMRYSYNHPLDYSVAWVDSIAVTLLDEEDVVCDVEDVAVSNITDSSATAVWTYSCEVDSFFVELKVGYHTEHLVAHNTQIELSELLPDTTYTLRVRGSHSSDIWTSPVTFRTLPTATDPVGIDAASAAAVRLYPNPATSSVSVEFEGQATVNLLDLSGRQVLSTEADSRATFDVSTLAKGAYFVRVTSAAGTAVSKLVVK